MKTVECPHCDVRFNLRESSIGKLYHCRNCRRRIEFFAQRGEKPPFNHVYHAVLTFLTCGLWLFVWPFCWLAYLAKTPPVEIYARRG